MKPSGGSENTRAAFDCPGADDNFFLNFKLAGQMATASSKVRRSATYVRESVDDCARRTDSNGFANSYFFLKSQESANFVTTSGSSEEQGVKVDQPQFSTAAYFAGSAATECILEETNPILETGI